MNYHQRINRLVAEKVLGWTLTNYETYAKASSEADYEDAANNDGWSWHGTNCLVDEAHEWQPSTDISQAWLLVERFGLAIQPLKSGEWICWQPDGMTEAVYVSTGPLSICLAALKIMEVEDPREESV